MIYNHNIDCAVVKERQCGLSLAIRYFSAQLKQAVHGSGSHPLGAFEGCERRHAADRMSI